MPVKKIFSLTFCALLLLASAVSAQENDARDTSSLQRAALEGFGARLTIELPPLEYCQLGRFSTKSEGNDFGFVGNTALPPRGQDTIYIGISSEETAAFSERGTVANRLSEYAHNLIAGELSSRTVPCRIDREYFLPQDGHPAWLITLAYENRPVRRSVFIIADEGRLWRVNALHHAQTPAQNTRMDAILTSIKLGRSDAAKPRVRFDGIQPIEFTERADTHGDASSHALSTTTIRDRGSALTMQLPPSGTPFAIRGDDVYPRQLRRRRRAAGAVCAADSPARCACDPEKDDRRTASGGSCRGVYQGGADRCAGRHKENPAQSAADAKRLSCAAADRTNLL